MRNLFSRLSAQYSAAAGEDDSSPGVSWLMVRVPAGFPWLNVLDLVPVTFQFPYWGC